ncbi:hypothetical protein ES288_A12G120800v1 [Gossypium darwinii]|uniref:Uncharacterized protein n=1 Tax=Gossypium darwinii TaxID=34276 RepID=A0A5D2E886_GOSDA|nr:hypothetical protein ES288_A12G120800v1 [Gossypium darwinii]
MYLTSNTYQIARVQDALLTACKLANVFLVNGIAISMVMKYADNIVKVYSTSVAMLLTAVVSVFLFGFNLTLAFFLGATQVIEIPFNNFLYCWNKS